MKKVFILCFLFTLAAHTQAQVTLWSTASRGGASNDGTVFSLLPNGTFTLKSTLSGSNNTPWGGVVQAGNGVLYGMTTGGGSGNGSIYSVNPTTNAISTVHAFGSGATPYGSLMLANNGKMYGMTYGDGTHSGGTIFSLDTLNNYNALYSFNVYTGSIGGNPQGDLMQASNGLLYGMTSYGGDAGNGFGTVFSFDPANPGNPPNPIYTFSGGTDGGLDYQGARLLQGSNGLLYGMTYTGGVEDAYGDSASAGCFCGEGVVFSVDPVSFNYTVITMFDGSAGSDPTGGLVQASNGLLYGMLSEVGSIFSVDTTTTNPNPLTYLLDFTTSTGDNPFSWNGSLYVASDGMIYGPATDDGPGGNTDGVLFSFNPHTSFSENIIYSFTFANENVDGWRPTSFFMELRTITTSAITGGPFCAGASVNVPFTITGPYNLGNVFTAQLSNASGSFSSPVNIGTVSNTDTTSGTISATIPGGTSAGSGYRIRVVSSNPNLTGTDNGSNITINAAVTPSVSIGITSGSQTECAGASVTFTATPTNGGASPTYNFEVNSVSKQNSTSATYTTTSLNNNDMVTCIITSDAPCASPTTATSNSITMTVNASVTPSVSIGITSGTNPTCSGVPVTFTATPTNGGASPTYNFEVNSGSVQNSSVATYTTSSLNNNDMVTCVITSDAACASPTTGTSNSITMTVNSCGANTWIGNTTAWATGTNWTVGVPTSTTDGIIPSAPAGGHFPIVSSAALVRNTEVDDNATITLNNTLNVYGSWTGGSSNSSSILGSSPLILSGSGLQTLTGLTQFQTLELNNSSGAQMQTGSAFDIFIALVLVNGQFDANTHNGTLVLESTSVTTAAYIDNFDIGSSSGTYLGNVTAQRYYAAPTTTNSYNQHEMGSPVNTPALSQFGASGTAGYVTDANCDGTKLDASSPYGTVFGYDQSNGASCGIQQWKVLTSGNAVNGVGYSIRNGGPGTLSLTGSPNISGNVTLTGSNSGWSTNFTLQGYPENPGWTLASNPYPATLQISSTSLANNVTAGWDGVGVMVWNTTGGSAGSYQLSTTIAPFQAFMIHKTSAGGPATYTMYATDRVTSSGSFYKDATPNMLNIMATNQSSGLYDLTNVGFSPNAASGFDPNFDVHKIAGDPDRHTLYTLSNGNWMCQNINPSIEQTPTVPMGFSPGVSGTYTLTFDGVSSFDATSYITQEDTKLNIFHDVRSGDYAFTADANDSWNRFVLHFTPPASINTANATCSEQGMINIVQPGAAIWNYTLSDNNNTILSTGVLNSNSPVSAIVAAGVYTITLTDNSGYTVVKTVEVSGAQPVVASFTASANSVNVNQELTLNSTSVGAVTNSWNFGDGTTDNGATVTHSYTAEGVYNVTLNSTSASGCISSSSNTITVNRSVTGVTDLSDINNILIWSNENIVNVDFSQLKNVQANIEIYNVLGQKLSEDKYVTSTVYHKEIPNIEEGYVVVSVKNNDEIISKKLFISNVK